MATTFKPTLREHHSGQDCNLCPFYGYHPDICEKKFITEFGDRCTTHRVIFLAEQPED